MRIREHDDSGFYQMMKGFVNLAWTPVCTGRPLTLSMKGDDMFEKDNLGKRNFHL